MPDKTVPFLIFTSDTFHDIVPPCTLLIHANGGHNRSNLFGEICVALIRSQVMYPHQVPGNLEVVTYNGTVLLPTPGRILTPILVVPLLNERAMFVVRKMFCNSIGGVDQEVYVFVLSGCQP